ncbi:TPA_asm: hypothetical protein GZX72_14420 [Listeria monocytogenes]|nr:hypothetical protein [Listeria monocytogenes]
MNEDYFFDRKKLIEHAKKVLEKKEIKGSHIAEQIDMNRKQLYDYRNGIRNIENARLETLLKFERYYHKIKHNL